MRWGMAFAYMMDAWSSNRVMASFAQIKTSYHLKEDYGYHAGAKGMVTLSDPCLSILDATTCGGPGANRDRFGWDAHSEGC